tara:strand:- start:3962 stop:4246 length:285 start_codon:yes stop_codon:yes gene_type:complete
MAALTEEQLIWSQTTDQLGNVVKTITSEFSDSADLLDPSPKAIYIQNGGNLKVDTMGGTTVSINGIPDDTKIDWLRIKKVYATGTSVTNVKGIY